MLENIFKIIFTPHRIKNVKYENIFVGIITFIFLSYFLLIRNFSYYISLKKIFFLFLFLFVNNAIRAFLYPIEEFRKIFPYYILTSAVFLMMGFFSFYNNFYYYPFIWYEILKGVKDINEKRFYALIVGIVIDILLYYIIWS
ncbi:hypothetical protein XO10_02665 [Marinitoga sp. 1135]|uniref:Uncharacterized protein n=1 Tax=Marinitoga piezophila (strain DSM 14283 / JCM 11233 / KA3) TaxID=443254 RepID=H2J5A4_MARPK|nr:MULTISPECIES: hypothetical protein [Marinitoga]AEX84962.1 hypothetical protein Marpi_0520 [Marinitoga piezophila KA3]APT75469.1 hypothetical protein LN42_02975 [Marinitoga sp. 1137]NUU95194.1 hypothetical protein [Marinitoga sp. 1135]NUU97126.1 hypothetical protein [Marinitoga sp. 1138]